MIFKHWPSFGYEQGMRNGGGPPKYVLQTKGAIVQMQIKIQEWRSCLIWIKLFWSENQKETSGWPGHGSQAESSSFSSSPSSRSSSSPSSSSSTKRKRPGWPNDVSRALARPKTWREILSKGNTVSASPPCSVSSHWIVCTICSGFIPLPKSERRKTLH